MAFRSGPVRYLIQNHVLLLEHSLDHYHLLHRRYLFRSADLIIAMDDARCLFQHYQDHAERYLYLHTQSDVALFHFPCPLPEIRLRRRNFLSLPSRADRWRYCALRLDQKQHHDQSWQTCPTLRGPRLRPSDSSSPNPRFRIEEISAGSLACVGLRTGEREDQWGKRGEVEEGGWKPGANWGRSAEARRRTVVKEEEERRKG
mmetsp:Transcript_20926/g.51267  ORF Transcript_20926/g.51267 Transcript_20926/m.51267 type:complete len:202 (+) Transcript_20926:4409-5014(+)